MRVSEFWGRASAIVPGAPFLQRRGTLAFENAGRYHCLRHIQWRPSDHSVMLGDGKRQDRKSKQLIVDRVAAQHVRTLFEFAAAGTVPTEIARIANQRGWRTRRDKSGGLWTSRQILKLLSNPTYAGKIRHGQDKLPGQHEAIVEENLFEAVRRAIALRSHVGPGPRGRSTWPLRGLLKCGRCGRLMIPRISQKGPIRYRCYRCRSTAEGKPACRSVGISAYEMERFVRSMIASVSSDASTEIHADTDSVLTFWKQLDERSQMLSMQRSCGKRYSIRTQELSKLPSSMMRRHVLALPPTRRSSKSFVCDCEFSSPVSPVFSRVDDDFEALMKCRAECRATCFRPVLLVNRNVVIKRRRMSLERG